MNIIKTLNVPPKRPVMESNYYQVAQFVRSPTVVNGGNRNIYKKTGYPFSRR
jgi:hypothetical protein